MSGHLPGFEEFVAPLRADAPAPAPDRTPLAELPVGDYALVTWLDGVHARYPFGVATEAEIVARWGTASLHDVYALVFPGHGADRDLPGARAGTGTGSTGLGLSTVRALFDAEIEHGLQSGVQLSMSYRGEVVDIVAGDNGAGAAMTEATTAPWTCSSKPLGAIATAAAWEAGAVELDTPVVEVLPEFTGAGKDRIRVRDLLTHTTGISEPTTSIDPAGANVTSWADIDALIWAAICAAKTAALPGAAMIYNPVTNWFVLDRVLNTLGGGSSGDSYRAMFDRLGLSATLGADWSLPADQRVTVVAAADQQAGLEAMQLASALPLPGVGIWGTMRDLRVVGELLLHRGVRNGDRVITPGSVEALTATHWPGTRYRSVVDTDFAYGLGVMTQPLVLGRRCSARIYGHAGGNTSTVLVDPLFDLVVAVYWNGRQNDVKTVARRYALVRALYADLGLPRLPVAAGEAVSEE